MSDQHMCVAIYSSHDLADEAFALLWPEGFGMDSLSFIGRDYWRDMIGSHNAG